MNKVSLLEKPESLQTLYKYMQQDKVSRLKPSRDGFLNKNIIIHFLLLTKFPMGLAPRI